MEILLGIAWLILIGMCAKGWWHMICDEQKEWERKHKKKKTKHKV